MFRVTFLGHQGWLFSSGDTNVLVDPLLTDEFSDTGNVGRIFPPRVLDLAACPPIDCVVYTHDHNDHFAVSSLARIDRRVPIVLPARASIACRSMVEEMGFPLHLADPGSVVETRDLECRLFGADHVGTENSDEWEVLPFLVRDRAGHGSMFSNVDVQTTPALEARVREAAITPGLWVYTNNLTDFSLMRAGSAIEGPPQDSLWLTRWILQHYEGLRHQWREPAGLLIAGGGLVFHGDREWLNQNVFRADSERVAAALAVLLPDTLVAAPLPGQTIVMEAGAVRHRDEQAPIARTLDRALWPPRAFVGDVTVLSAFGPACGEEHVPDSAVAELERHLDSFAAYLYGGRIFRSLYSLQPRDLGARAPTFVVVLRTEGGGGFVYEYEAQGCRFVPARHQDPVKDYLSGMELWASDLLAVARGELDIMGIVFGRGRFWNVDPKILDVSLSELWMYFHPLRHPDVYLRLYRRKLASLGEVGPCVRWREDSHVAVLPA